MDCLLRWLVDAAWLHRISRGVVSCGVQVTKFKIRSLLIRSAQIRGVGVLFVPPDPCCTGNNKLLFPVSSSAGVLICTDIRTDCRLKFTGGKKNQDARRKKLIFFFKLEIQPNHRTSILTTQSSLEHFDVGILGAPKPMWCFSTSWAAMARANGAKTSIVDDSCQATA